MRIVIALVAAVALGVAGCSAAQPDPPRTAASPSTAASTLARVTEPVATPGASSSTRAVVQGDPGCATSGVADYFGMTGEFATPEEALASAGDAEPLEAYDQVEVGGAGVEFRRLTADGHIHHVYEVMRREGDWVLIARLGCFGTPA